MAGITEIRSRMRSIEQTLKITNAMYLISSSKVKKARKQLSEVQPYFEQIAKTLLDIFRHSPELRHRFVDGHESVKEKKAGFVVVGVFDPSSAADEQKMRAVCDFYLPSLDDPVFLNQLEQMI